MKIKSTIFKAYDIRGLYPEEINEKTAYNIGRALTQYTKAKKIVVGCDMRKSSPKIEKKLINGIIDQGANVVKIGMATTPEIYFSSWKMKNVDAAAMITASHNPAEYNGIKFCLKNAIPISEGSGMEEIRDLAIKGKFKKTEKKGVALEDKNFKNTYLNYIANFYKKGLGKKKIVIDFANGMGILDKGVYEKLIDEIEAIYMYDQYDGNFPNHEANPLKTETLRTLQKKVLEKKADLGIAYDGDADRIGFIDEKGDITPMDYITAILAKEILKEKPGGLILYSLCSTNAVKEVIEEAGGRANRCRIGHSLIKKQMLEQNAIFAGELSGHYFFQENSKAEMATLAAIKIINLINETKKTLSELTQDLKRYYHSGEINSHVKNKKVVINKLKKIYKDGKLDEMDGIRIDFKNWWFNVRPSNTEPLLRLNLEAKTKKLMKIKKDEILKIIRK